MTNKYHDWLVLYLRFIGGVSLLAFAAAVMPATWMIQTAQAFGVEMADVPLSFYLARSLSLLYGFVGASLLVITFNMHQYGSLVWFAARGTVLLGVLQLVINTLSAMPLSWTLGESVSTLVGGLLMGWLDQRAHAR